jgi:PPOX class probable F420-dependent enzyme
MVNVAQFDNQKYLSLETYRRDGRAVQTPLWFAQSGDRFYIYSLADAGKVKRVRNNPKVRIAPCDLRGKLKGEWVEATARIESNGGEKLGHDLLNQKYGLVKRIGNFLSGLRKKQHTIISIAPA